MKPYLAILLAAAAVASPVSATAAPAPLPTRLERALAVPHVDPARSAALAVDLRSGEVVFERNRARALAPASTVKLAVSYALLVRLGPVYRVRTEALGEGALEGATWRGDLVLKGYGDPTLDKWRLRSLARKVAARGIRHVTGTVVADESFFDAKRVGPGWKRSYYIKESPPLSALVADRAREGARTSRSPALHAADRFRRFLREAGVRVAGGTRAGVASPAAKSLATVQSRPLARLLRAVNAASDNFAAELLLKHLGGAETGRGTTAGGAAVVMDALRAAGIPLRGVVVADGSGLSLLDRLTVEALAGILAAAWTDPVLRGVMLSTLAVSGRRGTLERRLRGPAVNGRVAAKTGTTSISSGLAGYVSGRFAFAILHNGSPVSFWWARTAQDRFVKVLASQGA
ncbi:MAG: D-alanyl-D-alanine carboxypeptidase/D-alanyl-D-alanine-endopeptidase [Thermoleophilia bacterium]|nr:D-alanyl-D-alanine carboxypeptidase/D-alanyl-D-alanine-endopeptidase [Thermoleophilia bacterium]